MQGKGFSLREGRREIVHIGGCGTGHMGADFVCGGFAGSALTDQAAMEGLGMIGWNSGRDGVRHCMHGSFKNDVT